MQGTVKWFNSQKGYGFLVDSETKEEFFIHYSQLQMDGFKTLNENDFVEYELGAGKDGREQAVNIIPILTMKMVEDTLKEEDLYLGINEDSYGVKTFAVMNQNNVIQTSEQGMSFLELAAYAGFDIEGLSA